MGYTKTRNVQPQPATTTHKNAQPRPRHFNSAQLRSLFRTTSIFTSHYMIITMM